MISIIIPVYKVEKYLKRCIDSILSQTYKDFEIILVDDGSPDNCPKMCDDYSKLDNRIITLHKKNGGQSSARNLALKYTHGDFIFFVDSDDWLSCPTVLEDFVRNAEENDSDFVFGLHNSCTEFSVKNMKMNNKYKDPVLYFFSNPYFFSPWNKLIRGDLFKEFSFEEGRINEDVDIIPLIIAKSKKVTFLNKYTYNYYINTESTTRKEFSEKRFDMFLSVKHVVDNFKGNEKQKDVLYQNLFGFQIFSVFLSILRINDKNKRISFIKEYVMLLKKYNFSSYFYYLFKCIIENETLPKKVKKIIAAFYLYMLTKNIVSRF